MANLNCAYCGKALTRLPYEIRKNTTGNYFCDMHCRTGFYTGTANPNHGKAWSDDRKLRASQTLKEQFRDGRKTWNKDLDKSDPRVAANARGLAGNQHGKANKGQKRPLLTLRNKTNNPIHNLATKLKIGLILSAKFLGSNNPNWRGGKRVVSYRGRTWQTQRKLALERDNYTCQNCGSQTMLIVHHQKRYWLSKNNDLDNLLTLCRACHIKLEPIGPKRPRA